MTEPREIPQSLICPLFTAAEKCPDDIAILSGHYRLTFRQYEQLTRYYAEMLRAVEPAAGQYMVFYEHNRLELPAALLACWRVNVVAVLVNRRYPLATIREHAWLGDSAYRIFFCGDRSAADSELFPGIELDVWPNIAVATGRTLPQIDLDQPATIMFTSGSTGKPKAVLHSYANHYYSALGSNENITVQRGDRWLLSLPMYHVGGLSIIFRCLLGHATIVMTQPGDDLVEVIEQHQITHLSFVATQLERLVTSLERSPRTLPLKAVLMGGGPTPASLIKRATELGLPIYRSYGLTEMASQVVTTTEPGGSHRAVLPYRELKLADSGEILVRGRTRFLGYLSDDKLDEPFTPDGWFATGDLGTITDDGLQLLGRIDNMWISGGENVHPEEIERALLAIDGIEQAVAVPVDDAEFGKRPVAFVRGEYDEDTAIFELRRQLPGYMIPIAFLPWPDDIASSGLKPNRQTLRELAQASLSEKRNRH